LAAFVLVQDLSEVARVVGCRGRPDRRSTVTVDNDAWVTVRKLDDFADLRKKHLESSPYWWPDIGPLGDTSSFSFAHRLGRLGPVTILDADFYRDVWVNGGELRLHYHVTLPVATPSAMDSKFSAVAAPGSVAVYRPEAKRASPVTSAACWLSRLIHQMNQSVPHRM
jgi:hypothetical protein